MAASDKGLITVDIAGGASSKPEDIQFRGESCRLQVLFVSLQRACSQAKRSRQLPFEPARGVLKCGFFSCQLVCAYLPSTRQTTQLVCRSGLHCDSFDFWSSAMHSSLLPCIANREHMCFTSLFQTSRSRWDPADLVSALRVS